ncbi:tetratricopeptide repeat protein [Streptomyces sp. NBC_01538]|uniref:tetratricopeptide repeat protein n=1 Tax=Streptomyces sp. NBC_01538 TaxID=2903897 RepID=UPI00386E265A
MSGNQIGGSSRLTGLTVQAGTVFGGIHHHVPPTPLPVPRQLPVTPGHFTDRERDRSVLDCARAAGTRLLVISGIGGVGKSALAIRWLSSQGLYDGGQLHVDLSGPEGLVPSEAVLRRWLRAFGIDRPPAKIGELTGLWRSVTATRAVAVLIDGATAPEQVRPLLPSGADSTTVVTSRTALRELAVDGAVIHQLGPLAQQAALQLLSKFAGQERIAAAPGDADRLADACYRLPLPLVLAGARLTSHPHRSVATVADALTRRSTAAHTHFEDPARMINTALDETYQELEEETRQIYRRLGLLPVHEVDPDMTAAVCELSWERAEWGLEVLAEEQLLEPLEEQGAGARYRLIPAARDHARSMAVQHDSEHDRVLVLRRLCEWILAISTQAQFRLTPAQATLRRSTMATPPAVEPPFDDHSGALAWLESYEGSLLEVLRAAEAARWDELTWQLVDSFWPLFLRRHPYELWSAAHEIGLAAARRAHNDAAVRQMLSSGAIGLSAAGRLDEAIGWYAQALEAAQDHGDPRDEGQALLGLGSCHLDAGRPHEALPLLAWAITLWEKCGYPRGVALATIVLGEIALTDEPGRALKLFARAHTILLEVDDPYDAARALVLQGHARALTGDVEDGIREMTTGLATLSGAGSTRWRARALELLGHAHLDKGDATTARDCYQHAEQLYEVIRPADAARVRSLAAVL